jgi:hypothetical protein
MSFEMTKEGLRSYREAVSYISQVFKINDVRDILNVSVISMILFSRLAIRLFFIPYMEEKNMEKWGRWKNGHGVEIARFYSFRDNN